MDSAQKIPPHKKVYRATSINTSKERSELIRKLTSLLRNSPKIGIVLIVVKIMCKVGILAVAAKKLIVSKIIIKEIKRHLTQLKIHTLETVRELKKL